MTYPDWTKQFQLISTAQQGWECPKCQSVYSPSTPRCFDCGSRGQGIPLAYPEPSESFQAMLRRIKEDPDSGDMDPGNPV